VNCAALARLVMMANSGKAAMVARLVSFILVSSGFFVLVSKAFFFEKKNQKTFAPLVRAGFTRMI